jgi:hypothetical protein
MIVDRDNEISFTEMGRRTPPTSICNNTQQEKLYNFTVYSIHINRIYRVHAHLSQDIVFPGGLDMRAQLAFSQLLMCVVNRSTGAISASVLQLIHYSDAISCLSHFSHLSL